MGEGFEKRSLDSLSDDDKESIEAYDRAVEYMAKQVLEGKNVKDVQIDFSKKNPNSTQMQFESSSVIKADDEERTILGDDTVMHMKLKAEHGEKRSDNWVVEEGKIKIGEGELDMEKCVPENVEIILDYRVRGASYGHTDAEVHVGSMASVDDVVNFLHEAGHAKDMHKNPPLEKMITARDINSIPSIYKEKTKEERDTVLANIQSRERMAWANALHEARKNKLPIQKLIRFKAQTSLATYDDLPLDHERKGLKPDLFASKEQRNNMRDTVKRHEAELVQKVTTQAENISRSLTDKVGLSEGISLKGRYFSAADSISHALEINEKSGIRYMQIDLNKNLGTATEVNGGRDASVKIFELGKNEKENNEQEIEPNMISKETLSYKGGGDYTNGADNAYELISEQLQEVQNEDLQNELALSAFANYWGDVSVPSEMGDSGQKLSMDERLDLMKNDSVNYKAIEGKRDI